MEIKTLPHGQVVLPLEICRRLGIEAGTRLEVEIDEKTGCIRLRPLYCAYENNGNFTKSTKTRHRAQPKQVK